MANFSSVRNSSKKKSVVGGIVKFKFVVEKLQKRLILLGRELPMVMRTWWLWPWCGGYVAVELFLCVIVIVVH